MYVTPSNFIYAYNFPTLQPQTIQNAITYIDAVWSGCFGTTGLWQSQNPATQVAKQTMLENLLVAWNLADLYPKAVSGIIANGFPIASKTIGGTKGVSLTFRQLEAQPGMEILTTNVFGNQALSMMTGAPERFGIYNNAGAGFSRGTGGGFPM